MPLSDKSSISMRGDLWDGGIEEGAKKRRRREEGEEEGALICGGTDCSF